MKNSREISLAFVRSTISMFFHNSISMPVLGLVISLFPTMYGCESVPSLDCGFVVAEAHATTKVSVCGNTQARTGTMDILVFNDDDLQKMDCYQRMEGGWEEDIYVSSQKGDKIMLFYANTQHTAEDWMWISSLSGTYKSSACLEKETREAPVMSGMMRAAAGGKYSPKMERLSAEVALNSLCCDFEGKAYEGERLENVSVYLTNVNAESPIWRNEYRSSRFINQGRLSDDDVRGFCDPSLIIADIEGSIGKEAVSPDIVLRCYENISEREGPGTPHTRLVIQGDIQGVTWYWPIAVKSEGTNGVEANRKYTYDILITGKGSADPDTEIERGNIKITADIEKWTEKEEYKVIF